MIPIMFGTEWIIERSVSDGDPIWLKLRRYFGDRKFEVPHTPIAGMTISLYSFLDSSFTEKEKDETSGYNFIVEEVCMHLDYLIIFAEGTRLLSTPDRLKG
ncbi:hypothetical protein ACTJIJ_15095 [Niabella sp. 22666]|uniref:hypothetical protein n=1 Tax=Niabella sp. 22666 TaxID=3453954 RepID=UPI003F829D70